MSIIVPKTIQINSGFHVTYQGDPYKCAYWKVVGLSGQTEIQSTGFLTHGITINDSSGFSVNTYFTSSNTLDIGKTERIKVTQSA